GLRGSGPRRRAGLLRARRAAGLSAVRDPLSGRSGRGTGGRDPRGGAMTAPPAEARPAAAALPAHHRPGGGFRNPWPTANGDRQPSVLRWWWERLGTELPPDPRPAQLPRAAPDPRRPRAAPAEMVAMPCSGMAKTCTSTSAPL